MKIREIRAAGLRGETPRGGWSNELRRDDCVHTLIAVLTDEGLTGLGSVFTSDQLVRSSLAILEPFYKGENALEPERVSEKLHQHGVLAPDIGHRASARRTVLEYIGCVQKVRTPPGTRSWQMNSWCGEAQIRQSRRQLNNLTHKLRGYGPIEKQLP